MDFSLPTTDGKTIVFRPPTLRDVRTVNRDMALDGGIPPAPAPGELPNANDPRNSDFVYRMLHRCAVWPVEAGARPGLEDFLDLIPISALNGRGEEMGAFFGGRAMSPSSSTPSSDSASV